MLGLRKSRTEKTTEALKEVVSYANELLRDDQLRSDLQSAVGHGAAATERVRKDTGVSRMTARLGTDKKLRKHLRAMLDDLDRAGDRARHRQRHRVRKALLLIGGGGVAMAAIPGTRRWLTEHLHVSENGSSPAGYVA
jgi:hypothetical protein